MVLFLTSSLFASIFGMSGIIATKRWENRTGKVLFASVRPRLESGIHQAAFFALHTLPSGMRRGLRAGGNHLRFVARHAVAASILWLESTLERLLQVVRHTAHAEPMALASSSFLQEVAEYKKTLMRRAPARRRIVSEE